MAIPSVDLAEFLSGDEKRKNSFVQSLGKAYEEVGFVAVKNHGIPDQLIAAQYDQVQQFFSLPLEKKLTYQIDGLAGQRGYTSFGTEHAKGSEAPDLKEFFVNGHVNVHVHLSNCCDGLRSLWHVKASLRKVNLYLDVYH